MNPDRTSKTRPVSFTLLVKIIFTHSFIYSKKHTTNVYEQFQKAVEKEVHVNKNKINTKMWVWTGIFKPAEPHNPRAACWNCTQAVINKLLLTSSVCSVQRAFIFWIWSILPWSRFKEDTVERLAMRSSTAFFHAEKFCDMIYNHKHRAQTARLYYTIMTVRAHKAAAIGAKQSIMFIGVRPCVSMCVRAISEKLLIINRCNLIGIRVTMPTRSG